MARSTLRRALLPSLLVPLTLVLAPNAASAQVNAETFRKDLKDQPHFVSLIQ